MSAEGQAAEPRRSSILLARDAQGRILLVRQRAGPFAGHWLLPGGGLEAGESFEDALHRELYEETGMAASAVSLVARYEVETSRPGVPRRPMVVHMFAGLVTGEPRVGSEGEAVGWREVSPSEMHPVLLRELLDGGVTQVPEALIEDGLRARGVVMTRLVDPAPR